ncbi:hypothetical protein JB92DRAFT_91059 [Gautieria morchelliformis]|nr:hypothetical protein JB92DRAFT_91059 [Gautieria morchelliformis]
MGSLSQFTISSKSNSNGIPLCCELITLRHVASMEIVFVNPTSIVQYPAARRHRVNQNLPAFDSLPCSDTGIEVGIMDGCFCTRRRERDPLYSTFVDDAVVISRVAAVVISAIFFEGAVAASVADVGGSVPRRGQQSFSPVSHVTWSSMTGISHRHRSRCARMRVIDLSALLTWREMLGSVTMHSRAGSLRLTKTTKSKAKSLYAPMQCRDSNGRG